MLPQQSGGLFVTDGGMETTLVFHEGIELPCFAAFPLLAERDGRATLTRYFDPYLELARRRAVGLVLDTATWRANRDWGARLGYSPAALEEANREAVALLEELRATAAADGPTIVISGCIGPRGDGYSAEERMSADEAAAYHEPQIATFADTAADHVSGLTMTYVEEAVGIARAARERGVGSVISFTVETDGRLPSGQALGEAIEQVDEQTGAAPAYYMINCAHPTHFAPALEPGAAWIDRLGGLRANASRLSHAELDESTELDEGDPAELGQEHGALRSLLPRVTVVGGCCGTDHRHVAAICDGWLAAAPQ